VKYNNQAPLPNSAACIRTGGCHQESFSVSDMEKVILALSLK